MFCLVKIQAANSDKFTHFHLRVSVQTRDRWFKSKVYIVPYNWTHMVLNFLGPYAAFEFYADGNRLVKQADVDETWTIRGEGPGKVVIGGNYVDEDNFYSTADVDELLFFNQLLTEEQVNVLTNIS